jgi:hypothetical protein
MPGEDIETNRLRGRREPAARSRRQQGGADPFYA